LGAEVERAAETWVYTGRKGRFEKMAFPFPKPPADWGKTDTAALHSRLEKGKNLYADRGGCVECHGKDGRSNPVEIPTNPGRRNDWGDLNPPRNLTYGYFRGGSRPADLYYRFRLGIAGSGMPAASDKVTDEEVWYLVDYVLNLPQQQR
jgi:mono/diheme cytochrome c family protein